MVRDSKMAYGCFCFKPRAKLGRDKSIRWGLRIQLVRDLLGSRGLRVVEAKRQQVAHLISA